MHTAPGHGPDDFEIGKKYGLKIYSALWMKQDYLQKDAGKYFGQFVKYADINIIEDIKTHHLLFRESIINHRYGFCWRCKTPIIYLATKQWFLKITDVKEQMLSLNLKKWNGFHHGLVKIVSRIG